MRSVVLVQARMGSTRLPGKVLQDLHGVPLLAWAVERAARAAVDEVRVATTVGPADDPVAALCAREGWPYWRGSEHDVLARFHDAAREARADVIVRITADCPFTDPALIDAALAHLRAHARTLDLVTNMLPPSWPMGLAVEALPFDVLARMHRLATEAPHREHVTLMVRDRPDLFRYENLPCAEDLHHLRWTVDTPDDLAAVRAIAERIPGRAFGWREALAVVAREPDLARINGHVTQKVV